jgi:hypothetical protein
MESSDSFDTMELEIRMDPTLSMDSMEAMEYLDSTDSHVIQPDNTNQ